MKFITAPKVYLISRPHCVRHWLDAFLHEHGYSEKFVDDHCRDAEQVIATGSRTCYQSFDNGRKPDDHIKHLIEVGHGSVLEHANFSVLCAGISRSCSHELVRHRHLSPSQLSQRYVDHSDPDSIGFVVPPVLVHGCNDGSLSNEVILEPWKKLCESAVEEYTRLYRFLSETCNLPRKIAAETARSVLPNCTETRILLTGNLRGWRNFFEQRCSEAADAEIRRLACAVYEVIQPHAPTVFADYEKWELADKTFAVFTKNKKV